MIYKLEEKKDRIKDPRDLSQGELSHNTFIAIKEDRIWIFRLSSAGTYFEKLKSDKTLAERDINLGQTPQQAAIKSIQQMIVEGFEVYELENPEDALCFMMEGSHA